MGEFSVRNLASLVQNFEAMGRQWTLCYPKVSLRNAYVDRKLQRPAAILSHLGIFTGPGSDESKESCAKYSSGTSSLGRGARNTFAPLSLLASSLRTTWDDSLFIISHIGQADGRRNAISVCHRVEVPNDCSPEQHPTVRTVLAAAYIGG